MKVEIVGPNLLDQSTGSFHVHAANCAHLNEYQGVRHQRGVNPWLMEAGSQQEIVEEIYTDLLPTDEIGDPTFWDDFADDVHIFPCVTNRVPKETDEAESLFHALFPST